MVKKSRSESTGRLSASAASKVLRNSKSSEEAKSAAGSALAQVQNKKETSRKAASAASKTLRNPKASKADKSAAASALTQRPNRKN